VAPEAYGSLDQMMLSVNDPTSFMVTGAKTLADGTVRVTMSFDDTARDLDGNLVEVVRSFVIRVRVDDGGAVIVGINAGT